MIIPRKVILFFWSNLLVLINLSDIVPIKLFSITSIFIWFSDTDKFVLSSNNSFFSFLFVLFSDNTNLLNIHLQNKNPMNANKTKHNIFIFKYSTLVCVVNNSFTFHVSPFSRYTNYIITVLSEKSWTYLLQ